MAKTVCKILGLVFLLVGLGGFVAPNLLGAHLNPPINLVYIVSAVIALYFGFAGSVSGAKRFSLILGAAYLVFGTLGILLGGLINNRMLAVSPLKLTVVDYGTHILLGVTFLAGGLFTTAKYRSSSRFNLELQSRFRYDAMERRESREMGYKDSRAEALSERTEAQVRAGTAEEVPTLAREISDEDKRAYLLIELAKAQAKAGKLEEAIKTLRDVSDLRSDDRHLILIGAHGTVQTETIEPKADRQDVVLRTELPTLHTQVFLGAATPRTVVAGSDFVARFAAYNERFRAHVAEVIRGESPKSEWLPALSSCEWKVGTKITVRLSARDLNVKTGAQEFTWCGKWEVLRFDVDVPSNCPITQTILKFDVAIAGVVIATLRPEIEITRVPETDREQTRLHEARVPRSAFASYSRRDRKSVLGRVRSLQIAGIDVFLDCLSIRPGEQWKPEILKQIRERDIFFLFWSRRARNSKWVEWEWRNALDKKTLSGIQPHPLEPAEVAPPPPELEQLHFGSAYEFYLWSLRDSWFRRTWHRVTVACSRFNIAFRE